jgi:competence protein ComEC
MSAPLPEGRVSLVAEVLEDPMPYDGGFRFVARPLGYDAGDGWTAGTLAAIVVVSDQRPPAIAGTRVEVSGMLRSRPGRVRGDPVAGRLVARSVHAVPGGTSVLFAAGNALRSRVTDGLASHGSRPAGALMAGFLIGDTSGLDDHDLDALRRSGLTHYVAVSGSNVALFLLAWWLVTAPLSVHPRLRGGIGLVGLALFVVVTRWEPSVLRAATMAGLVLGGRVLSIPVDAWTGLGGAAVVLLGLSGQLAADVGFQLSAVATAGVLAGTGLFTGRRPKTLWTALAAAVAAQAAVVPVLLAHFGTVPLLSPVANLAAAPLVTAATTLGGLGVVTGIDLLTALGVAVANGVLSIASLAAEWPQLGWSGSALVAGALIVARRAPLRPFAAVATAGVLAAANLGPAPDVAVPTVTVFDVGQGDAVLLRDAGGVAVLVDAGRDPRAIRHKLEAAGVRRLDLLVATHGDADHVGGMVGLAESLAVDRLWIPDQPDLGMLLPGVVEEVARAGGEVTAPHPGMAVTAGSFRIDVLGPKRRYLGENDGSIVLMAEAAGTTVLLAGDIEAVAQRELPDLVPDVLLVPHHGSATTDLEWLAATVGDVAVVSVGENTYGHPSPDVLVVLEASGAAVYVTKEAGDVVVPLAPAEGRGGRSGVASLPPGGGVRRQTSDGRRRARDLTSSSMSRRSAATDRECCDPRRYRLRLRRSCLSPALPSLHEVGRARQRAPGRRSRRAGTDVGAGGEGVCPAWCR